MSMSEEDAPSRAMEQSRAVMHEQCAPALAIGDVVPG
jgi:hypothetical protein